MRDAKAEPSWVGMDGFAAAICFNTVEAEKQKLPKPTSWQDLTKPVYAGKIVMPNPASSGTGFLDVSAWLQIFGEEKGWAYMDALHKNIGSYTHSGSKPCNLAASGEFPIGVSFDYRAAKLKADGAPVEAVFPSEGLGWEVEATAIVKGTKNLEAARKLADFSASREANELYKANFAVLAIPSIATSNPNLPADLTKRMIKNDFTWAATNRDRIIAEWTKRYDGKSEPKKKQAGGGAAPRGRCPLHPGSPFSFTFPFFVALKRFPPKPGGAARNRLCRSVTAPLEGAPALRRWVLYT